MASCHHVIMASWHHGIVQIAHHSRLLHPQAALQAVLLLGAALRPKRQGAPRRQGLRTAQMHPPLAETMSVMLSAVLVMKHRHLPTRMVDSSKMSFAEAI